MPYIMQAQRKEIDEVVDKLNIDNAGELNYAITKLVMNILLKKGISYANINEFIGALECAKLELYRVVATAYEDHKKNINGVVSPEFMLKLQQIVHSA